MNMQGPFKYSSFKEKRQDQSSYDEFEATELYCPKCGRAVSVIKSLLLILPEGDKYEYRCRFCGTSVGDKIDRHGQYHSILKM
jgi:DNA-directed RNA polymerase subunit RPC12/RpoP